MSESQNIEYKESWRDEYLKWICGFANAQGGSIFIGIDDSGNVVCVKNCKKLMEDIPNKIQAGLGIVADVNKKTKGGLDYIEIADKVIDLIYLKYLKAKITYEHDKRKDEAIIITNQCVLPEGWTAETFLKTHESNPYNPDIANVFYRAGYIENWGRGIEKICDACKELGSELPVYEVRGNTIRVHFKALKEALVDSGAAKDQNVGVNVGVNVAKNAKKLMELISENPNISAVSASEKLNISKRQTERLFAQLKENNLIKRVGTDKTGHWEIIEPTESEK